MCDLRFFLQILSFIVPVWGEAVERERYVEKPISSSRLCYVKETKRHLLCVFETLVEILSQLSFAKECVCVSNSVCK